MKTAKTFPLLATIFPFAYIFTPFSLLLYLAIRSFIEPIVSWAKPISPSKFTSVDSTQEISADSFGCGSFATSPDNNFRSHNIPHFPSELLDYSEMASFGRRLRKFCRRNFTVSIKCLMIPFVFTGFMEVPIFIKIVAAS